MFLNYNIGPSPFSQSLKKKFKNLFSAGGKPNISIVAEKGFR
jgi:hypothetical protein